MDAKLKHLEFIQAVISRMAGNSFLLRGWSVTLVVAVLALANGQDSKKLLIILAVFPVLMFWGLDGYFLRQERLFRKLYDRIRLLKEEEIDFSMDTSAVSDSVASWLAVSRSKTLMSFYLPVVIFLFVVFWGT